jgi:predicted enzyme related to lactoylglutathione lyase
MISGVSKVALEVDDQDRAKAFWTDTMGFELVQDTPYGDDGSRWLEVGTPDGRVTLILGMRQGPPATAPDMLPTSNVFFACEDLQKTYEELRARGVEFTQPPVQLDFGWWSLFTDSEGTRFALVPLGR